MIMSTAHVPGAKWLCLAMIFVALGGCSQFMTERQRYVAGWRPGQVIQIDDATGIRVRFALDCRGQAPFGTAPGNQYALVKYQQGPSVYRYRVAPLSVSPGLHVGDLVDINIDRCEEPMVKLAAPAT